MKQEDAHIIDDRLLDALNDPDAFSRKEWEELLKNEENVRDVRLLEEVRQAFARNNLTKEPDVEQEWRAFSQRQSRKKPKRKMLWIGIMIGLTASVLLFFGWYWNQPTVVVPSNNHVLVFVADSNRQEVMLATDKGQQWMLSDAQKDSSLQETGINWQGENLSYEQVETKVETHLLTTPRCTDYHFTLSDGTQVWLNAESSLKFPSRFVENRREVILQGEGFFKVARDTVRPFIVHTGEIVTEVLGTEFNVRNYAEDDTHVTLLQGSVKVRNEDATSAVVITPGQDARLLADGSFEVKEVDTDSYYLWTEGYFYFDNEPVVEILRALGRWYNMDVEFQNPNIMHYRLHFLAEREQKIEDVLQLLNMMGKMKAQLVENKIVVK